MSSKIYNQDKTTLELTFSILVKLKKIFWYFLDTVIKEDQSFQKQSPWNRSGCRICKEKLG